MGVGRVVVRAERERVPGVEPSGPRRYVGCTAGFAGNLRAGGNVLQSRDANAGENLYVCPAQNIWTQISGTATSLHPGTAGGILISNTAANFDVDADTMFLSFAGWEQLVFTGHNDFSGAASLRIVTGSN